MLFLVLYALGHFSGMPMIFLSQNLALSMVVYSHQWDEARQRIVSVVSCPVPSAITLSCFPLLSSGFNGYVSYRLCLWQLLIYYSLRYYPPSHYCIIQISSLFISNEPPSLQYQTNLKILNLQLSMCSITCNPLRVFSILPKTDDAGPKGKI